MDVEAAVGAQPWPEVHVGQILDHRYRLLGRLGEGGMGIVYRAEHIVLGEQVAIKILSPRFAYDREWVQRFLIEARAARRIQHPNVVRIIDVAFPAPGLVYMVMELLSGEPLSALIGREGRLPWPRAFAIVRAIAEALAAAHALGVVHRDIKPANCMVSTSASGDAIKVLDFGIAKLTEVDEGAGSPQTATGQWMGTAEYMAPESFRGEPASDSMDVYALGVTLYKLVAGVTPFRGNHMEVATQLVQRDADPPSRKLGVSLPSAVEAVVMRAIARDTAARTPSMAALLAEIEAVLGSPAQPKPARADATMPHLAVAAPDDADTSPVTGRIVRPSTRRPTASTPIRRTLLLLGSALVLGLVLIALLVTQLGRRDDGSRRDEPRPATNGSTAPPPHVPLPHVPQPVAEAKAPSPEPEPAAPSAEPDLVAAPSAEPDPVAPPTSEPVKPTTRSKSAAPTRQKAAKNQPEGLPELLTVPELRAELATMRGVVQDKCFRANRAVAGTRVQMNVLVDPSGVASARQVTTKHAAIGACLEYWIRGHKFAATRNGGRIELVFIAE